MESLIVGLALSLCIGLAYIAYTHPRPFSRIANILLWSTQGILLAIMLWDTSATVERSAVHTAVYQSDLIPYNSKTLVGEAIAQVGKDGLPMKNIFIVYAAWFVFLTVLKFLPRILNLEDKGSSE